MHSTSTADLLQPLGGMPGHVFVGDGSHGCGSYVGLGRMVGGEQRLLKENREKGECL